MHRRKRDVGDEGTDLPGSPLIKAVRYNQSAVPADTPSESEEGESWESEEEEFYWLKVLRRRAGGNLDRPTLYIRTPRVRKDDAAGGDEADEEDEEGHEYEEEGEYDEQVEDQEGYEDEGEEEDDDEEQEDEEDGDDEDDHEYDEEHQRRIYDIPFGNIDDEMQAGAVEDALEYRLLGIGKQNKQALHMVPQQPTQTWPLCMEQEEALIAIYVEPFKNPNAVGFATSTGARKHTVPKGVSLDTAYTPDVEHIVVNTGAQKGTLAAGVDPNTTYAGDVMLFPTLDCVSKGIDLRRIFMFACDEEEASAVIEELIEADGQPATPTSDATVTFSPALPPGIQTPARTLPARKVVRLAFRSLKTSEEPSFERSMKPPLTRHEALGHTAVPSPPRPSALDAADPTEHSVKQPSVSLTLQAIIQGSGIPRSLNELDLIVEGLAEGLRLVPGPSYLDMRGGRMFDLDKEMARYSRMIHGRYDEPVDHTGRLLSLLNIDRC